MASSIICQALFGGAWLDPGIIDKFTIYAEQAFERLGPKVHFWATLNEPKTVVNLGYGTGLHAPGIRSGTAALVAGHNMLLAHAAAGAAGCCLPRHRMPLNSQERVCRVRLILNTSWSAV